MTPVRIRSIEFSIPKRGKTEAENDDRYAVDLDQARFAIADGATESSFSGPWAGLLVRRFMEDTSIVKGSAWGEWLSPIQKTWLESVEKQEIPWYAEEKVARGAHAAFLGLVIRSDGTWRAIAVGDCCLFQFRNKLPRQWFPFRQLNEFPLRPWLLGSRSKANEITGTDREFLSDKVLAPWLGESLEGPTNPDKPRRPDWKYGDEFILATDALSKWFVNQIAERWGTVDPPEIPIPRNAQEFVDFVNELREKKEIESDDVTMIRVTLKKPKEPAPQPAEEVLPMAEEVHVSESTEPRVEGE
ncbi:MAG: hypothetical protein K8U57_17600 [Planctomycetes bacterium]|nr:hypothetical protein [Planctomycetota bacterium]